MNQLIKITILFTLLLVFTSCKTDSKPKVQQVTKEKQQEALNENAIEVVQKETIDAFLKKAKEVAKGKDDRELEEIIHFPFTGYRDTAEIKFSNLLDIQENGMIYSFFMEDMTNAYSIKNEGDKLYMIKFKLQSGHEYNHIFEIDKIDGQYKFIGVEIPGA
ncbi:hypothetical protein [Aquimarina sp. MMG016]|uniref:hypothetical protein n=1 Tax=Aquimarina sp. MMG016 TaxID=2822690 RepID=UPI001B39D07C|nr:hypothetical protein [Aquimarina sp. MMG016]MBQ4819930.1 hypothetical protein [Aquimarina sp. MMG016]